MHVNEEKLEPRTKKCVFVGYPMNVNGYKLWCLNSFKFLISRDVIFDEPIIFNTQGSSLESTNKENEKVKKNLEFEIPIQHDNEERIIPQGGANLEEEEEENDQEEDQTYSLAKGWLGRSSTRKVWIFLTLLIIWLLPKRWSLVSHHPISKWFHSKMQQIRSPPWMKRFTL
jgi:hypothetical protein